MKLFVPGRICLFGEHSDWAGGYRRMNSTVEKGFALLSGTNQGIHAEVSPHPDKLILTTTEPDGTVHGPYEIPMEVSTLFEEAQKGGYWSYVAGVAHEILTHYKVQGLEINNFLTDLPIKKGLSSSAAVCVLTARAFNHIYDLKMTIRGEMEFAYKGEISTPSRCGRLDQGCAFGTRPILMTFDGERIETRELTTGSDLFLLIVDLNASKDTRRILSDLNRCYPFADDKIQKGVHQLLGPINRRIVSEAVKAVEQGEGKLLGELMNRSQEEFDRYATPVCPEELTAPVLHKLLKYPAIQPYIWGGKGVGSQGDGTAQLVAKSKESQDKVARIVESELKMLCLKLNLTAGPIVRKAVIPVAGFGTRLFPATKAVTKGFFPVIDRDGIAKPVILVVVEEALSSGIDEIVIVVQKEEFERYHSFFNTQVSIENFVKLPNRYQEYAERLLEIGKQIHLVEQPSQDGFGHAVFCSRETVGDEPFLLMLGDHIYQSHTERLCSRQMIEAFRKFNTSVVGLYETPKEYISSFGTVGGYWSQEGSILNVTEFAEKPTIDYAENQLHVAGMPDDKCLSLFGQYLLTPRIFEILEEHISKDFRERGEIQLTSALERLRQEEGCLGVVIDGDRYDVGQPNFYSETLASFSGLKSDPGSKH